MSQSDDDRAARFAPAQTNTALYCQLHVQGHSLEAIRQAQAAYRVCCRLFNGRYRKTERAFICHAVGAASAVAQFDSRLNLILAGMLHAAYDSGQYPDGRFGPTAAHRRWLSDAVGQEVESIVAAYNEFDFDAGRPEELQRSGVPSDQHDLLLIALAHEIDDLADGGLAFAPKYGRSLDERIAACAALARMIDRESLADALERHGRRYHDLQWIAGLEQEELQGFRIAPNWWSYLRMRRDHRRGKSVDVF